MHDPRTPEQQQSAILELRTLAAHARVARLQKMLLDVGDIVESLREDGHKVDLDAWHAGGSDSVVLHDLSGEFSVEVWKCTRVEGGESA